jgi:hypothetical protein
MERGGVRSRSYVLLGSCWTYRPICDDLVYKLKRCAVDVEAPERRVPDVERAPSQQSRSVSAYGNTGLM